jgi:lipopolysaccharide biosynthesis regulator YciM
VGGAQNMGRLAEAKPYFQQAVATYEAVSPRDTPNMAAMLNNLAGSYRFQVRFLTVIWLMRGI